jgi:3-oxoacyl-[acyl-carrier protein] reductase
MGVLDGKVAIVTGAARGIGRASAALLHEHGAQLLINDLDANACEDAARELGGSCTAFAGDLTKPGVPEALIAHAIERYGKFDILVNNAGYTRDAPLHKLSDAAFQAMLDIHTVVPFRLIRAAAPHLRGAGKADREAGQEVFRKIVNVTSVSGTMGNAGQSNYAAAKAGLVGLTKTLAKEWGPLKVNVNAVAFGFIATRLTAPRGGQNAIEIDGERLALGMPEEYRDPIARMIPLGRAGTPAEAAGGVFFLCSPWSNYVHGQVLNVTGGLLAGMSS